MSEFFGHEGDPGRVLALASSIAQRNVKEQSWQLSVLAETVPLAPQPPLEVMQSMQTGAVVAMLESLENPDRIMEPTSFIKTVIDDKAIADIIRSSNEEPNEENTNLFRAVLDGQVKTLWEHFIIDHDAQQKLKDLLGVAATVADQHAVSIYDVFSVDDLYFECMRTLNTPETYAEETAAEIKKVNQEFMLATLENMVEGMLQAAITAGEATTEECATEKAKIMERLEDNEEVIADLDASLSVLQQAGQRLILRGIERFWGKQVLDKSVASLGQLAAKGAGDIPLSSGMHQQQRYNDIVATLCIEKGWDPNILTIEQMRDIHANPLMQSFQNEE